MIVLFAFVSCFTRQHHVNIGVVDVIDEKVCLVQGDNEEMIEVKIDFCRNLKEGDIIQAVRKN